MRFLQNLGGVRFGAFVAAASCNLNKGILPPNGITGVFWFYAALTVLGLLLMIRYLPKEAAAGGLGGWWRGAQRCQTRFAQKQSRRKR